jgi:lipooligosaccharide transport system permease protein
LRIKSAYRVWQRHLKVYTKLYLSRMTLNIIEPMLYLTAMGMGLGVYVSEIEGMSYMQYIAPGIIAYSAMFATSGEGTYGTYVRMTYQKTFDAILATPVGIDDLVAGEVLWGATKGVLYGSIIMATIWAMGLVDSALVLASIPAILLCGIIFAEASVLYAALVPGIDYFNYFFTLFLTPTLLFSGVFFPLSGFPPVVEKLAFFSPLYHLVNITRATSTGAGLPWWDFVWLLAAAALLAPYPFRAMRRRIVK